MAATTPTSQVALPGSLLCITCHQVFEDAAAQREHYRSDVHRFNLKRKVAGLAPVSAETYNAKQDGTSWITFGSKEATRFESRDSPPVLSSY